MFFEILNSKHLLKNVYGIAEGKLMEIAKQHFNPCRNRARNKQAALGDNERGIQFLR